MNNNSLDYLDGIDFKQSIPSESMLLKMGIVFYESLVAAERADELQLLVGLIHEYAQAVSRYGEVTERIAESTAVDLNEAAIMKLESVSGGTASSEWLVYANQFRDNILLDADHLGIGL